MRKSVMFSALFFLGFSLFSCEKANDNILGKNIQPDDDLLSPGSTDTISFFGVTLIGDSVVTDELSNNLLGEIYDPVFGKLSCRMVTQFRLTTSNADFGDVSKLVIDSVVLALPIESFYGDTTTNLALSVQRLSETIYPDSIYYSNSKVAFESTLLNVGGVTTNFTPLPSTKVKVGSDTLPAQIRIPLENSFGKELISQEKSIYEDNDKFTAYLKGVVISAKNESGAGGSVLYLTPLSVYSQIKVYYKVDGDTTAKNFAINITQSSARFTNYTTDYTGTPIQAQLDGIVSGSQVTYVQAGGLLKTRYTFPYLDSLITQDVQGLNKAELVLPIDVTGADKLKPSAKLALFIVTESGAREVLIDQLEGETHFGGLYNSDQTRVVLNITRAVQQHLRGVKRFKSIEVIASSTSVTANRTVINGDQNARKPKLILTYTKF